MVSYQPLKLLSGKNIFLKEKRHYNNDHIFKEKECSNTKIVGRVQYQSTE